MTWRFRKSFSPLPGVRITLSPSGVSTSVGVGPARFTVGPRGSAVNVRIPGTGVSYRQPVRSGGSSPTSQAEAPTPAFPVSEPPSTPYEHQDIMSAGTRALTTPGLAEYKRLLEQARREHGAICRELAEVRSKESVAVRRYTNWKNGWLFRRLLKKRFEQLAQAAEESTAHRIELEEQEKLARLQTEIEIPGSVSTLFHRMCDEFSFMCKANRIWDTVSHRATNRVAERTAAAREVERKLVTFRLRKCDIIESDWTVPCLENANGGDIFFYPIFVLYFISSDMFALLEYADVKFVYAPTAFIESESVPSDSKTVGHAWAKSNKDGSRDLRFKDNYQIPIALYGKITLMSSTGMNEEYMISNVEHTETFAKSWHAVANAIRSGA